MIRLAPLAMLATSSARRVLLRGVSTAALAATGALLAHPATAQTSYIGPTGDANWSDSANWTNGVPNTGNSATVNNGTTVNTDGSNSTGTLAIGPVAGSAVNVVDNTSLAVYGTISNQGVLSLNSNGNAAELQVNRTTVTLNGGGTLSLGNSGTNYVLDNSSFASGVLVNVDNAIRGSGQLGYGTLSLDNQAAGTVTANQPIALVLQTNGAGASNEGLMQATAGGTLSIQNTAVTQSGAGTILATGSGATVSLSNSTVTGGTLSSSAGGVFTSTGSNTLNGVTVSAGSTYHIADNTSTSFTGTTVNNGTISLDSASNSAEFRINRTTATLTGGGTLSLSNNPNNYVDDSSGYASGMLVNVDNTIKGSGQLGNGQVSLDNQAAGTVTANQSNALVLRTNGAGASNEGLMQATSGGTLSIQNTAVTQSGAGTILATGAGATVSLNNSTVTGGTLSSSAGGVFTSSGSNTLNGVTVSAGSTYHIADNTATSFTGTTVNNGTIALDSAGNPAEFRINRTTATLTGGGTLLLSNNPNNSIDDSSGYASGMLVNVDNTIKGSGQLGNGQVSLDNQAAGTVTANQSNALVLRTNGAGASNEGLMQATSGGTLSIQNTAVTQTGAGTILATGTGSTVVLSNSSVNGGTLTSTQGGTLTSSGSNNLTNATISAGSTYHIADNSATSISGTIANNGTIALDSVGNTTELQINRQTTNLTGGGTVTLSGNGNNYILDNSGYGQGVLNTDNTIQGSGQVGYNSVGINNTGTINANNAAASLVLQGNAFDGNNPTATGVYNQNLIQATNGGTLDARGTITQTGTGVLQAGNGSTVLVSNATVNGGTLTTTGSGVMQTVGTSTLQNVTLSAGSTYTAADNTATNLVGTITNNGNIALASMGNNAELRINRQTTTLTGGGTVTLSNSGNNYIDDASGYGQGVLVNQNNTIQGAGNVGYGSLGINNAGVITANANGGTLVLQGNAFDGNNPTATGVYNQNLIQATNGGTLDARGTITQTSTGLLQADNGSTVVVNNATINGGTLTTTGSGVMRTAGNSTLQNVAISAGSTYTAADNTATNLVGTINNSGNIALASMGNNTELRINRQTTTLTGGGTVTLSNTGPNYIDDASGYGQGVLVNQNNTIQGAGNVGTGTLSIQNGGTLLANQSNALNVNTNGAGLTNTGTLQATAGATLNVQGGPLTNYSAGTLTGGTYRADAGSTVNLNTAGITTNAATVVLNGTGSAINTQAGSLESTLTSNAGTLQVVGNRGYATANDLGNSGLLQLGGGTLASNSLANSGTLTGFGTLAPTNGTALANSGTTIANGGVLTLSTGIAGTGTLQVNAGSTASLAGAPTSNTVGTLAQNGTLATSINNVTVSNDYTNANFGTGNDFNKRAGVTGTGQVLAAGDVAQAVTGAKVTGGTTAAPTLSLGDFHTNDAAHSNGGATGTYAVANTGTTGPSIRGAVQTTGITDSRLSGSGVTAQNFGPVATGGSTTSYTVSVSGGSAGALTNQSVHLANNFSNVGEQTLAITGTGYNYAQATVTPTTVDLGNFRAGSTQSATVNVGNTAPTGAYTEKLDGSGGATTGNATVAGAFTGLAAGSSSNAIAVGLNTSGAGAKSGTATLNFTSNASGVDSLGNSALGSQTVNVTGNAFRLATGSAATPVSVGNVHVGDTAAATLAVTNTAANDGFSEKLNAAVGSTGGNVAGTSGSVALLQAGSTSTAITARIDTSTAGAKSGTVGLNYASDGTGTTGAAATANGTGSVTVTGNVYNLASSSAIAPVNFGVLHTGTGTQTQSLSVTNTAPTGAYSEGLDSSFGTYTNNGGIAVGSSGTVTNLAAGSTDGSSLKLSVSTAQAGSISGSIQVHQASNGTIDGLANTALPDQNPGVSGTIQATGTVTNLAQAQINTAQPVAFGNVRVGSTATQALSITNAAPDSQYSEKLVAGVAGTTGGVTATGGFGPPTAVPSLAAQQTDASHVVVGIDTSTAGSKSGNATLSFQSDGTAFQGGGYTDLGTQNVAVTGAAYRLANPTLNTSAVTLAARVGGTASSGISVTNTSPDIYTEGLKASTGASSAGFTGSGSITNLTAGGTSAAGLQVALNTSTSGTFSGTQAVNFTSTGAGTTGATDLALAGGSVALNGKVYQTASASVTPNPVNFGTVHVGDTVSQTLTVGNTASGALTDVLTGGFGAVSGPFTGSGTLGSGVAAGTTSSALAVALNTSQAGAYNGSAALLLNSHDDDLSDVGVAAGPVALSGTVNNYAISGFVQNGNVGAFGGGSNSYTLNFGTVTQGSMDLMDTLLAGNLAADIADYLSGAFQVASGSAAFVLSGFDPFSGLGAGGRTGPLSITFDTTNLGMFSETIRLAGIGSNDSGYSGSVADSFLTLTGTVQAAAGTGGGTDVPEPGTLAILGGAMAGLFGLRRRRG